MQRSPERVLDEYLVLLAQAGARVALAELARRWSPRLIRHARRLLGSADQADEAMQDAWLGILRGIGRLKDPARFPAWAYSIATRKCADVIRTMVRARVSGTRATRSPDPPHARDDGDGIDVRNALEELPDEQALVTAMYYGADRSVEEIAEALAIPAGGEVAPSSRARNSQSTPRKGLTMSDLDKAIRESYSAEDAELMQRLAGDPTIAARVHETFRGPFGGVTLLSVAFTFAMLAGGGYCVWRFFSAEDVRAMLIWGGGAGIAICSIAMVKILVLDGAST